MQATFASAYLRRVPEATHLLSADFRDPLARLKQVQIAAARPLHPALFTELAAQNLALPPSPARKAHLDALADPAGGCALVVTGQQVGLFLGPLYTIYKAASAIAAARQLTQESGVRCIPLFWLQTEDHDFAEIDHCDLQRPGAAPLRLTIAADAQPRVAVAHRQLGRDISDQLDAVDEALADLPHLRDWSARLRAHYLPGVSLASAFAGLLGELFADEGLLFLDPRRPAVAALAAPIYRQTLLAHAAITAALVDRRDTLHQCGFREQIRLRPDSSLLFFHPDGADTPRYRLERLLAGDGFRIPGIGGRCAPGERHYRDGELLELCAAQPLRFSTSAMLRPLVQDALLPTAVYIGGPAELSYFAQLSPLYPLLGIAPCMFLPRARFRCTDDRSRSLLAQLGLAPADAETPREALLSRLATQLAPLPAAELRRDQLLADLNRQLVALASDDRTLAKPLLRTQRSLARNVDRFLRHHDRQHRERDQLSQDRVDRLQRFLFPNNGPQERSFSLHYFAARYGASDFTQLLLANLKSHSLFDPTAASSVRDLAL